LCTSSHFATAERQFRNPLELGTPKTPTAQNTVTAAGAALLSSVGEQRKHACVTLATAGSVIDMGINDVNNMGAAMAPAAAQTILTHLEDTGRKASDYDTIITGDLGQFGSQLLLELCFKQGADLEGIHQDCGMMIYGSDPKMYCGGSGCGCGASMLCGYFLSELEAGHKQRVLFVATGALHSPTSTLQGETVPGIAHAVAIEME
jgi:stage V sporulation protein AD